MAQRRTDPVLQGGGGGADSNRSPWAVFAGLAVLGSVVVFAVFEACSRFLPDLDQRVLGGILAAGTGLVLATIAIVTLGRIGSRLRQMSYLSEQSEGTHSAQQIAATLPAWLRCLISPLLVMLDERERQMERRDAEIRQLMVQRKVSETERGHLEDVLHSLRDAVIVTNEFNEITLVNEAGCRLFGFEADDVMQRRVDEVMTDQDLTTAISEAGGTHGAGGRRVVEYSLVGPGDRVSVFETSLTSMGRADTGTASVVTILHEVTREREISQMKSDFVSKASHELKTPLSSIKAYVEMLQDGEVESPDQQQEFYRIIQGEVSRLERLIANMLNISRIESGIIEVEWQRVDMNRVIREVVDMVSPQAKSKEITLSAKLDDRPIMIEADSDMMQQVVVNLVSNAIKYTPNGGRVAITAEMSACNNSLMLTVADTGLGIPPDAVPRLFEKFFRVENYKRVAKGTGLGLTLVKQVVETVHGGEVGVKSELGMGSKFWFTVPTQRATHMRAAS